MMTFQEFCADAQRHGANWGVGQAARQYASEWFAGAYHEYVAVMRDIEAAENAVKYLDPYNQAVSEFCEYQLGSACLVEKRA